MAEPAGDSFDYHKPGDLSAVRAFVADRASALGLGDHRTELLVLAVSELATNTLQHTAGGGRVRVFARAGVVVCDVVDQGPLRRSAAAHAGRRRGGRPGARHRGSGSATRWRPPRSRTARGCA